MTCATQLSNTLKERYDRAAEGDAVLVIHLFGIEFATELEGVNLQELAETATGHRSYGTEIRKGVRISEYVTLK